MSKNKTRKFYRPGTLKEKGTKISLKTQPYINGVIFDIDDPITSFQTYISTIKLIIEEYEIIKEIPGINDVIGNNITLESGITGKIKLLLDYLSMSPIEMTIKTQEVDKDVIVALEGASHE